MIGGSRETDDGRRGMSSERPSGSAFSWVSCTMALTSTNATAGSQCYDSAAPCDVVFNSSYSQQEQLLLHHPCTLKNRHRRRSCGSTLPPARNQAVLPCEAWSFSPAPHSRLKVLVSQAWNLELESIHDGECCLQVGWCGYCHHLATADLGSS